VLYKANHILGVDWFNNKLRPEWPISFNSSRRFL